MDYFLRPFEEIVYLRFNNFNDMNKEVTSFIHKMNSYNRNKNKELKNPFINPNNEIKISENTDVHESINFISNLYFRVK